MHLLDGATARGRTQEFEAGGREPRAGLALAQEATFTSQEAEAYRRVFDEIQQARDLADEAARKGEARGREVGLREGEARGRESALRDAIADLCEAYGIELTSQRVADLAALDLTALTALRYRLKAKRAWPDEG